MKKLLFSSTLIFFSNFLFSQADCMRSLIYSGRISIKNFDIDKIFLPSTSFLIGYKAFDEPRGSKFIEPKSEKFHLETSTHISSDFCRSPQEIIDDFFKKAKLYPVKISEKMKDHI